MQGLLPPTPPYPVKEMGDLPQQNRWSLLKRGKHKFGMIFHFPSSTLLTQDFCAFWEIWPFCLSRSETHQETEGYHSFTGNFRRHHSCASALRRDYCNTGNTWQNLVFCTPEVFQEVLSLEKRTPSCKLCVKPRDQSLQRSTISNKPFHFRCCRFQNI